jgi:hypothetical protein
MAGSKCRALSRLKPLQPFLILGFIMTGGCAHSDLGDAEYQVDSRQELQKLSCPTDKTAVCIERIGQPTRCFCSHRDDLEALLEPE